MLPADWHPPLTKSVTDSTGNPCTARRVTLSSPISGPWPDGPWVVTVPPPLPLPYENGEPPTVGLTIGSAVVTAVDTLETLTAVRRMKVSWVGEATYECDRRPPAKKSPVR